MSDNPEIRFEGIGVSPGVAFGSVHVVREETDEVVRYQIAPSQVTDEIGRFEAGLIQTRMQILEMQQRIAESIGAKDAAVIGFREPASSCARQTTWPSPRGGIAVTPAQQLLATAKKNPVTWLGGGDQPCHRV